VRTVGVANLTASHAITLHPPRTRPVLSWLKPWTFLLGGHGSGLPLSPKFYDLSSNGLSLARFIRVRLSHVVAAERNFHTRALSGQTGAT
jgi:hypothetical protein